MTGGDVDATHCRDGPFHVGDIRHGPDGGELVTPCLGGEHGHFRLMSGITHLDSRHETVPLGLGKRIGALHLDRVLGGNHHEGLCEPVGLPVRGDLPLGHGLQQGGLGFR